MNVFRTHSLRPLSYAMRVLVTLVLSLSYCRSFSTAFVNHPSTFTSQSGSRLRKHCTPDNLIVKASSLDVDISNDSYNSDEVNGTLWRAETGVGSAVATVVETDASLPDTMLELPRHAHNDGVNKILLEIEHSIQTMHMDSKVVDAKNVKRSMTPTADTDPDDGDAMSQRDAIFANTYVDLGKVDTVGFDYDYTLVHYTDELLELLYDMALKRLVNDRHYPLEMLESGLCYDPFFSIRGECIVYPLFCDSLLSSFQ